MRRDLTVGLIAGMTDSPERYRPEAASSEGSCQQQGECVRSSSGA